MTGIKQKRKPSQKSIFLKPSLVVGNTKTWVSIGETMQEIATKEELSAMGGAKLVGTSSIDYIDGAVCKGTEFNDNIGQYNDYIAVIYTDGMGSVSSSSRVRWVLTNGDVKTITLLPIEFDYIILRPNPLMGTYNYYYTSTSDGVSARSIYSTIGSLPGNYDIIIHDNCSTTIEVMLQISDQYNEPMNGNPFTLSANSSAHQLSIKTIGNYSWTYSYDNSTSSKYAYFLPVSVQENYSTLIGPCLGLYTILYYKY